jgi:hypothetical protein
MAKAKGSLERALHIVPESSLAADIRKSLWGFPNLEHSFLGSVAVNSLPQAPLLLQILAPWGSATPGLRALNKKTPLRKSTGFSGVRNITCLDERFTI